VRALALSLALPLFVSPSLASASALERLGFGPRAIGLAGAVEASSAGALATWDNPSLLGGLGHPQGGLVATGLFNALRIEQIGGADGSPAAAPGDTVLGSLAVASPVGGVFADRLGFGLALHIPLNAPTAIASRAARQPQVPLIEGLDSRLVVALGVGYRLNRYVAVGVTGQLLARLDGGGTFRLSVLDRRFTDQRLDVDLISRVTPTVGLAIDPSPSWRLGLVWRAEANVRYRLPLTVNIEEVGDVRMKVDGVGLWSPMSLALAAQWQVSARWRLMASARWERWSALPPLAPAISLSVDDAALAAEAGVSPETLAAMQTRPVPLGASDIVLPRVGVEGALRRWLRVRAGVAYRATPLPRATGSANYLDAPNVRLGVGATFAMADPDRLEADALAVDIGLGWDHLLRRTAIKRDPADPIGGVSLEGDAFCLSVGLRHAL
jgi:hypothetical protein